MRDALRPARQRYGLGGGWRHAGADERAASCPWARLSGVSATLTHEEYALARTERKNGMGYRVLWSTPPPMTLEEDLARARSRTINSIAAPADSGQATATSEDLVDPTTGQQDLKNRALRQ